MADYLSPSAPGNFTNPAYASPEQLKAQRDYAAELLKRSTEGATRPAGVAGAMIDALTSNLYRSNADRLQSQAAQQNAQAVAEALRQARGPGGYQNVDPALIGQLGAVPSGSPEQRSFVQHLLQPQNIESPYKQPASISPAIGVQAPQLPPNYTPGAPYSQGVEGVSQSGLAPPPPPPRGSAFGGMKSKPAGWDQGNVPPPAGAPLPPLPGPDPTTGIVGNAAGGYQGPMGLKGLFDFGQKLKTENEMRAAGSGAAAGFKTADLKAANEAPALKTLLTTMLDDVNTHGQDWTMGPTADAALKIKKIAANYAPGYMKDKLESIASAESFSKISATIAGMTPTAGNSDAQLVNRIESNPSLHNTVGGAAGLLKMRIQLLDQTQKLGDVVAAAKTPEELRAAKKAFFDDPANRIINPTTGHPIAVDLESSQKASSGGISLDAIQAEKRRRQQMQGK